MKNPLNRRLPRELFHDKGKYIALFLFLVLTIGFVSGFLVADNSMKSAYDNSFQKYKVEDGHFTLAAAAPAELTEKLEEKDVTVSELFYKNITLENENTIRVFKPRTEVNLACIMEGALPETDNEIAVDRLYAENNDLAVGDKIKLGTSDFTISGTVSLFDYNSMFKNNTDMMFDAAHFSIAVVNDAAFEKLSSSGFNYCYTWRNNDGNLSKKQKTDKADELKDSLVETGMLTDFVKQSDNQAIMFTGDDMGSDKMMMIVLLYVLIVILAFVFAVTTKSTIEQEASAIGTLRASGYTRGELLRHYLALPMIVTLAAAVLGNALGYTLMKKVVVDMYYHSYSLPTYETLWNAEAFLLTTLIPCVIILLVNLCVLIKTLSLPPLSFLRRELKKKTRKHVAKLPDWKFTSRFRARIILQNIPAYITMFLGIFFASLLLIFGLVMNPLLQNFKTEVTNSKISDYQYILKAPAETDKESAEKYCVASLNLPDGGEEITVYGVAENSDYIKSLFENDGDGVYLSNGYMEKYGIQQGDTITLSDDNNGKDYTFTVSGGYDYAAALSIFMPQKAFNEKFGNDENYFNGYFTNEKLDDIDDMYVGSIITPNDLTVIASQLDDSMGDMFTMVCVFAAVLYILLMYLLAKLVVEKNASSVSMIKILGYTDKEAGKLYNRATSIVVILSLLITLPLDCLAMKGLFYVFMAEIHGWLTFWIAPWIYPAMFVIGIVCYFIVHLIQSKKIAKIPMSQALKNME